MRANWANGKSGNSLKQSNKIGENLRVLLVDGEIKYTNIIAHSLHIRIMFIHAHLHIALVPNIIY